MTQHLFLLLVPAILAVAAQKKTPLVILPLGDSITYGCGDNCTSPCSAALPCTDCLINKSYTPCAPCSTGYRLPLFKQLAAAGSRFAPTFVGPLSEGPTGAPAAALAHGGWPGIRISGQASSNHTAGLVQVVNEWGKFAKKADAILLHIGTNDVLQNGYASAEVAAEDMIGQLAALLAVIQSVAPHARIYVASVILLAPTPEHAQWNAQLTAFNAAIPFMLEGFVARGGDAIFVDMARGAAPCSSIPYGCCTGGGIHPSVVGYDAMARVWYDAVESEAKIALPRKRRSSSTARCFIDPVWNASELYHDFNHPYGASFNALTNKTQTLEMDLYAPPPSDDSRKQRPTVVLVHGGSFVSGDKSSFASLAAVLAARGFIVASINYRLTGAYWGTAKYFPNTGGACCPGTTSDRYAIDAVEDARAAVRFLRSKAADPNWRLDPQRIALGGGSAGAVTSAFYGYANDAQGEGESGSPGWPSDVGLIIPISGELAYDAFCKGGLDPTTGAPQNCTYGSWNHTREIDSLDPPLLLVHGTADTTVPFREALSMQARANATDLSNKLVAIPGAGHVPVGELIGSDIFLTPFLEFIVESLKLEDAECPHRGSF